MVSLRQLGDSLPFAASNANGFIAAANPPVA